MKLSARDRAIVSELLSVAELCAHDEKIRAVVSTRVVRILTAHAQSFPFLLDDSQIAQSLEYLGAKIHA
jgi:hypothetical protein